MRLLRQSGTRGTHISSSVHGGSSLGLWLFQVFPGAPTKRLEARVLRTDSDADADDRILTELQATDDHHNGICVLLHNQRCDLFY